MISPLTTGAVGAGGAGLEAAGGEAEIGGRVGAPGVMDFNSKSPMVDTRWDIFEHQGVFQDYLDIMRIKEPLKLLDKYRIDHVLVSESWPLAYLLERTPGWRVEKREGQGDDTYVLLAKTPDAGGDQSQCAAASAQGKQ